MNPYGIYNAITSEPTIPKVKERMPWDKRNSLDVDEEWRQQLADTQDGKQ